MLAAYLHLLTLFVGALNSSPTTKPTDAYNLSSLLKNLTDCDIQIIEPGKYRNKFFFADLNLVFTSIFLPNYEFGHYVTIQRAGVIPAIHIFKARIAKCRLTFILYDAGNKVPPHIAMFRIIHWILIASGYNHYYRPPNNHGYDAFLPNINAVITVVTDTTALLPYFTQQGVDTFLRALFYYFSVIYSIPGQPMETCFPLETRFQSNMTLSMYSKMICRPLESGKLLSTIEKFGARETWCSVRRPEQPQSTMDRVSQLSVSYLWFDIFSKTNISYTNQDCHMNRQIKLFSAESKELEVIHVAHVITYNEGYQFLTCHSEPYITFAFYFSPYQSELWIVLGITIVTIILLTTIVHHFHDRLNKHLFSPWLFMLASLFEEGGSMPSMVEKATFFRLAFGIWSLVSVILTNGYNGIMISDLNSPRELAHPETFDQLHCEKSFEHVLEFLRLEKYGLLNKNKTFPPNIHEIAWIEFSSFHYYLLAVSLHDPSFDTGPVDINVTNVSDKCYRLLSSITPNTGNLALPQFLAALYKVGFDFLGAYSADGLYKVVFKDLNLFTPKYSFYPKGFSYLSENYTTSWIRGQIEGEIIECGKTVFIAKSSDLRLEYEFLSNKYPNIKFFTSSQVVQNVPSGILFRHPWKSVVIKNFINVVEYGIWTHVDKAEKGRINGQRSPVLKQSARDTPVNIATLVGALPTVFILSGGLVTVAILVFSVECRARIYLLIGRIRHTMVFRIYRKFNQLMVTSVRDIAQDVR